MRAMNKDDPIEQKKKFVFATNTLLSIALITAGLKQGNTQKAKAGLIKIIINTAKFSNFSKRISFLKNFDIENISFGISAAGIAMRAPQLLRVLQTGSPFSRSMAGMICAAFFIQAVRPIERFLRSTCRKVWSRLKDYSPFQKPLAERLRDYFASAAQRADDIIYDNSFACAFLTAGPKIFMGLNAAGTALQGYMQKDWNAVSSGATYLAGIFVVHAAEKYFTEAPSHGHRTDILGLRDHILEQSPHP